MDNFDIILLNEEKNILIMMKTSESPFEYLKEIEVYLRDMQYIGIIFIDELLHSGNTEERFIKGYFNGDKFEKAEFCFETISRKSKLREYVCHYLRDDKEFLYYSGLTSNQQRLIEHGCII